jgi:tRNA G26 N,N-dimethylase Trm1
VTRETTCATSLDESSRAEKIQLRLWAFSLFPQRTALDLYAGEGNLSRLYAKGCSRLICVEQDPEVFKKLMENMRGTEVELELLNMDNQVFLDRVAEVPDVTFVDFDAYGCPNPQVAKFFENYPMRHGITVNVTDGSLLNLKRLATIDLAKHYLINLYPKGYLTKREFDSKRGLRRLLPWLQETFIHLLAAKYGFNTCFLYHAMNSAANCTYYGFIAYPDIEIPLTGHLGWATGKTPLIRYKSDEKVEIKDFSKRTKHN